MFPLPWYEVECTCGRWTAEAEGITNARKAARTAMAEKTCCESEMTISLRGRKVERTRGGMFVRNQGLQLR